MAFLKDGYQTLYSFAANPEVLFKEISITPPGIDGGDSIDTTTMRNEDWRSKAFRQLKTLTESQITVSYDPAILEDAVDMINVNQLITLTFPDDSTWEFWGAIRVFAPGELSEGERPTATITVEPSNEDDNGDLVAPEYSAAAA